MRHYRFKRHPFPAPVCCATLRNKTQCSNTGIYVNGVDNYCGVHLHKLDREIEVYDLVVSEESDGYKTRVVQSRTTLRAEATAAAAAAESEQCSICISNIAVNSGVLTRCGHAFHLRCFNTWNVALDKNTCPICREPLRTPLPTDQNALFSLMDVIDDPRVREALLNAIQPTEMLRIRAFSYDEAVRALEHMPTSTF